MSLKDLIDQVDNFIRDLLYPDDSRINLSNNPQGFNHNASERKSVREIFWVQHMLTNSIGASSFCIGAALSNVRLPSEIIEMTQFLPKQQCRQWYITACSALCNEATQNLVLQNDKSLTLTCSSVATFPVKNYVEAKVGHHKIKVSPNDTNSLLLCAIMEEVDNDVIGLNHLFKRSLALIKTWCLYESKKYFLTDLKEVFSHDSLVVMTLWLFVSRSVTDAPIEHALDALVYFLEDFSTFDWDLYAVSCTESIELSTLYSATSNLTPDGQSISYIPSSSRQGPDGLKKAVESIVMKYRKIYSNLVASQDRTSSEELSVEDAASYAGDDSINSPFSNLMISPGNTASMGMNNPGMNRSNVNQPKHFDAWNNNTTNTSNYMPTTASRGQPANYPSQYGTSGVIGSSSPGNMNTLPRNIDNSMASVGSLSLPTTGGYNAINNIRPSNSSMKSPHPLVPLSVIKASAEEDQVEAVDALNFSKFSSIHLQVQQGVKTFFIVDPINPGRNLCEFSPQDYYPAISTIHADQYDTSSNGFHRVDYIELMRLGYKECTDLISQLLFVMTKSQTNNNLTNTSTTPIATTGTGQDQIANLLKCFFRSTFMMLNVRVRNRKYFNNFLQQINQNFNIYGVQSLPDSNNRRDSSHSGQGSSISSQSNGNFDFLVTSKPLILSYIKHAESVLSHELTEDMLLNLILQVLNQLGPTPIGEIGKQLQVITGNANLLKELKKSFFGLKRFISLYPTIFQLGDEHNLNPKVFVIGKHV